MNPFVVTAIAGSLVIIAGSFIHRDANKLEQFCVAVGLPVIAILPATPELITPHLHPHTVDLALYHIDQGLGLDSFALARLVCGVPVLTWTVKATYDVLPLVIALGYTIEHPKIMLKAMLIAPALALVLYNIVPAVGPRCAFSGYPLTAAGPVAMIDSRLPTNCFPSMHFGWALLLAWNMQSRIMRTFAYAFAGMTAIATIATGEHYFIDLIVAFPLCWAVQAVMELRASKAPMAEHLETGDARHVGVHHS